VRVWLARSRSARRTILRAEKSAPTERTSRVTSEAVSTPTIEASELFMKPAKLGEKPS
jgi:hypothetical protein